MKRFFGLMLATIGGIAVLWGGYHVLTGQSTAQIEFTPDFSLSAMTGGLAGLAVCILGLVWARD